MEAITPGDEVAVDFIDIAVPFYVNAGTARFEIAQRNLAAFETHIATIAQAPADEILYDFLLTINGHGFTGEFDKWNAMKATMQAQFDAFMTKALLIKAVGDICAA